uniref:Uncharacterized protein n=1 Tax=Haptolina brevifila TaxID=156173 RepID=A0A7S2H127_9EUKA|mmetsp:Transcript_49987/g.99552  ORF Transcript_49987/g.99552 Transcript_49987/m.99552 type:complete len:267 (+) Transcript_49987:41-841(+)|eukprot:CAMPEP_0174702384 /NCGR_PEP_ID=MMETSP1094-20130205/6686_1 /TAXON_ID=156173 /ORGANISM="Chrysochromulina brevifilum, Strain UTEX LB 985" /LENGTH=266 /DNA_ID=CAMNT_0015900153 /DNA_START=40 /DNA_END=840 /DNA_ORIENTATION=+
MGAAHLSLVILATLLATSTPFSVGSLSSPPALGVRQRSRRRHYPQCCDSSSLGKGKGNGGDEGKGDISFSALRIEAEKRAAQGPGSDFGKMHMLRHTGPCHTTTPKQVVEHVLVELREGDIEQAFRFTCVPVGKRGTHKSSTDWSHRMAWEKCSIINGAPSGHFVDEEAFSQMVRSRYAALLATDEFRFLGDASSWQQKNGQAKMTAVKDYVVETKTRTGEHLLLKFRLVYDWLLYCHLVASVSITSLAVSKHFPGADDFDLSVDI